MKRILFILSLLISVAYGQNVHVEVSGTPSPLNTMQHFGKLYNVADYSGYGIAKDVTDAGMASNTTVSSITAAFTPGVVGYSCIMYGSGTSGANQTGTITAYISATQVTVSFTAASTVTNKEFFFGPDATAGIQAAINACDAAQGGKVWLPSGVYFISGSLITSQNTSNPNAQLYIPYHAFSGQFEYQIDIEGEQTVNLNSGYFGTPNPLPTTGVVLRSIIGGSGTNPSIIGGGDATHQIATAVFLRNFTVQAYTNQGTVAPALTGINGGNMYTISGFRVGSALDVANQSSADPSSTESAAWIVSFKSNAGPNVLEHCSGMGHKYGFIVNEHTRLENPFVFACVYAYVFPQNDFTITGFAMYHACKNGVYFPNSTVMGQASGASHIFDLHFECEIDSSAFFGGHWYNTYVSNINDPGNNGNGIIRTISVLGQVETPSTITVVGGSNLISLSYNTFPTPATPTLPQVLAAGNTSTSAQTLIMTGASGTSSIQITGSSTTAPQLVVGGSQFQSFAADNQIWGSNIKYGGSNFNYITSTTGSVINIAGGAFTFYGFPTGTAGAAATQTYQHNIFANGNFALGTSSAPTDKAAFFQTPANTTTNASIFLNGGTADVSSPTNGMLWYNSTAHTLKFTDNSVTSNILPVNGQTTLVSGTKTITVTGATSASVIQVTLNTPTTASSTINYQGNCTTGSCTIQANVAAGTINASDGSVVNYTIYR